MPSQGLQGLGRTLVKFRSLIEELFKVKPVVICEIDVGGGRVARTGGGGGIHDFGASGPIDGGVV